MKTAAISATVLVSLISMLASSMYGGEQGNGDPNTLLAANQWAKWTKDFIATDFDLLSGFPYPFPTNGGLNSRVVLPPPNVQKLVEKKVYLRGYVIPLEMDVKGVSQFILVRDLNTCCYGLTGDPNTWVVVYMKNRTAFTRYDPITVFGTLHATEIAHGNSFENIESFYQMDGDALAIHTTAFDKAAGITTH